MLTANTIRRAWRYALLLLLAVTILYVAAVCVCMVRLRGQGGLTGEAIIGGYESRELSILLAITPCRAHWVEAKALPPGVQLDPADRQMIREAVAMWPWEEINVTPDGIGFLAWGRERTYRLANRMSMYLMASYVVEKMLHDEERAAATHPARP